MDLCFLLLMFSMFIIIIITAYCCTCPVLCWSYSYSVQVNHSQTFPTSFYDVNSAAFVANLGAVVGPATKRSAVAVCFSGAAIATPNCAWMHWFCHVAVGVFTFYGQKQNWCRRWEKNKNNEEEGHLVKKEELIQLTLSSSIIPFAFGNVEILTRPTATTTTIVTAIATCQLLLFSPTLTPTAIIATSNTVACMCNHQTRDLSRARQNSKYHATLSPKSLPWNGAFMLE
jgi:hypothetical protein